MGKRGGEREREESVYIRDKHEERNKDTGRENKKRVITRRYTVSKEGKERGGRRGGGGGGGGGGALDWER